VRSGSPRLFLVFVNLVAFAMPSFGQATPTGVDATLSGGSKRLGLERSKNDDARSIELYRRHCINCHEEDGRGETSREVMRRIPDFTRPEWHGQYDDDHLLDAVWKGKGSMPAMKTKLGTKDAMLLVALVRDFQDGRQVVPGETAEPAESSKSEKPRQTADPAEPTAPAARSDPPWTSVSTVPRTDRGRGVFRRFCMSCHGGDGRGNGTRSALPGLPDFTSAEWQARRSAAQLTASLLDGKGSAMPAFGGKLNDEQVRDIVAYLRSLSPTAGPAIPAPSSDFRRRFEEMQRRFEQLDREYRAASSR
jgi:mono/diheme cytochrome c family protein